MRQSYLYFLSESHFGTVRGETLGGAISHHLQDYGCYPDRVLGITEEYPDGTSDFEIVEEFLPEEPTTAQAAA